MARAGPRGRGARSARPPHALRLARARAADRGRARERRAGAPRGCLAARSRIGAVALLRRRWYLDESVAAVLAELGYADSTATAFRPAYLPPGAQRLQLSERGWLSLADGRRLLELPTTHSLGMAARAVFGPLPEHVHVYFHDTDLLSARRRAALVAVLAVLGRRCTPTDVGALASEPAPLRRFSEVASGP